MARKTKKLTDKGLENRLKHLIGLWLETRDAGGHVSAFEETGLLTRDNGLVLDIGDQQWQITIVDSTRRR